MICTKTAKISFKNTTSSNINFDKMIKKATLSPETAKKTLKSIGFSWNKSGEVVIRPITGKK